MKRYLNKPVTSAHLLAAFMTVILESGVKTGVFIARWV